LRSGTRFQCVVHSRPSSAPASPNAKAPVHTEHSSTPARWAWRSHATSLTGTLSTRVGYPGTMIRSPGCTSGSGSSPLKPSPCADCTSGVGAQYEISYGTPSSFAS
jgi:hypothetical protein